MGMDFTSRRSRLSTTALVGVVLVAVILAVRWAAEASGKIEDGTVVAAQETKFELPVPPPFSSWIAPDSGLFRVHEYDDRALTDEEKRADPAINLRWAPFQRCVANAGFPDAVASEGPFMQPELDRLVARVNGERPDTAANKQINRGDQVPGLPGTFLGCADEWLSIPSVEELNTKLAAE